MQTFFAENKILNAFISASDLGNNKNSGMWLLKPIYN